MFEKELKDRLTKIFAVKKATYAAPSESGEQDVLFINIEQASNVINQGRAKSMVRGSIAMIGNADKLPFGFFSKRINAADPADTKPLTFYDFETNTQRYQNLVQRTCSFVYFFNGEYDPEAGSITSVEFTEETE